MTDKTLKLPEPPFSASDHVQRGDDLATAVELVDRLGRWAPICAMGRCVEAQATRDNEAIRFWNSVRGVVSRMEWQRAQASE